jgi:hypothetical protein
MEGEIEIGGINLAIKRHFELNIKTLFQNASPRYLAVRIRKATPDFWRYPIHK